MHFANPYFLFGLIGIAIPILIHLFNFRKYKKVYFSNVSLLEELQQKTKKQSELKHLIILALRILAICSIVLAFSQPYLPLNTKKPESLKKHAVSIFIDNSYSMEADAVSGTLFDEAKNKAKEILSAYSNSDIFQLITCDFEGKHQRFVSKEEFNLFLDEVKPSPSFRNISEVIMRQLDILKMYPAANKDIFIISDFQKSFSDFSKIKPDTTYNLYLIPLESKKVSNIFSDTLWFNSPIHQVGQNTKLYIRFKNISEIKAEKTPVKLTINNNQKSVSSIDIDPNSETQLTFSYVDNEPGIHHGCIEIVDNPIIYDNKFYFSYSVSDKIPIICINGKTESTYLNALFGKDSAFSFKNVNQKSIDYSQFTNTRLIILNELPEISSGLGDEIKKFVSGGGSIMIIPPIQMESDNINAFLKGLNSSFFLPWTKTNNKVSQINYQNPIFNDVFENIPDNIDLPFVNQYYPLNKNSFSSQEFLLKLQNGDIFMNVQPAGKGFIYLLGTPLSSEFTNFPRHAIFVPIFYKAALLSQPFNNLYYLIEDNEGISLNSFADINVENIKIKSLVGNFEFIPGVSKSENNFLLNIGYQIKEAGNYNIFSDKNLIAGVSFNYNRKESNLACYSSSEIKNLVDKSHLEQCTILNSKNKKMNVLINEINDGIKLWKIFVILALIFLGCEVILLRIFLLKRIKR